MSTTIFGALKIVIALTAAILLIIALAKPAWIVTSIDGSREEEGLFHKCYYKHYPYNGYDGYFDGGRRHYGEFEMRDIDNNKHCEKISPVPRRIKVVRAFLIMACIELLIGLLLAILVIARLPVPAYTVTILFIIASIFILIACVVYTATYKHLLDKYSYFGHSYWCAWAAFILTVLAIPLIALVSSPYTPV